LLAAMGLLRMERMRVLAAGIRLQTGAGHMTGRLLVGQVVALALASVLLLAGAASGVTGTSQALTVGLALAAYLYAGIVVPRKPLVEAARERVLLRRLTPGFVSYVRVALAGYEAPSALLARYVARPRAAIAPMQALVAEALTLAQERRVRPFAALFEAARARGCTELTDVAEVLAQAEDEGVDPQAGLAAHSATLEAVLKDEFTRMLKRRTLWLLCVVAVSLVVGILGNLLFVMTEGGSIVRGGL
jgi:hypothetical protein